MGTWGDNVPSASLELAGAEGKGVNLWQWVTRKSAGGRTEEDVQTVVVSGRHVRSAFLLRGVHLLW